MKRSTNIMSKENHGFTLIELLVGTAITALIVLSINMILFNATNLRDQAYETQKKNFALNYALKTLKKDLKNAIAPNGTLSLGIVGKDNSTSRQSFDALELYTTTGVMSDDQPWGDIQKVTYEVEEMQEYNRERQLYLVRSLTRNLTARIEEEEESEPLLRNVYSIRFRYYDGESWANSWDSSEEDPPMPSAMHVELLLLRDEEQSTSRDQDYKTIVMTIPIHAGNYVFETPSDEGEGETDDTPPDDQTPENGNDRDGEEQPPGGGGGNRPPNEGGGGGRP